MKILIKFVKIIITAAIAIIFVVAAGRYVNAWQAAEDERTALEDAQKSRLQQMTVKAAVDGDTLILVNDEKVRLLGIDAPESVHRDKSRNSAYGDMASEHMRSLVKGGDRIWVLRPGMSAYTGTKPGYGEMDTGSDPESAGALARDTDNYGRLLRIVWTTEPDLSNGLTKDCLSESLNYKMLEEGFAVTYFMEKDEPYEELFRSAMQKAAEAGNGLWSAEGWPSYAAMNLLGQ